MNAKPSPLTKLKLTEEQTDQLFEMLRVMPYYLGVKHCNEQWGIATSVSGLRRWWKRESKLRMRADLRSAVAASQKFDTSLDAQALDARAANAIRSAFWAAIANRDVDSIETLGKMVLDYNADARDSQKLDRLIKAERDLAAARAEAERQRSEIAELRSQLADAGKVTLADPAKVSEELDRHLGVKK